MAPDARSFAPDDRSDEPIAAGLDTEFRIPVGRSALVGDLRIPAGSTATIVFAHGSGSSRTSPRNQLVAARLRDHGLGTLLFDLLTADEERIDAVTGEYRFDIPFLANRLIDVTQQLLGQIPTCAPIGYFGASTGAAAALVAAAALGDRIGAVVSRGGRADLAGSALGRVTAPTLLLVGGRDPEVLELNRGALEELNCEKALIVVPAATHLFEEPGTLEAVAAHAADWFSRHLAAPRTERPTHAGSRR